MQGWQKIISVLLFVGLVTTGYFLIQEKNHVIYKQQEDIASLNKDVSSLSSRTNQLDKKYENLNARLKKTKGNTTLPVLENSMGINTLKKPGKSGLERFVRENYTGDAKQEIINRYHFDDDSDDTHVVLNKPFKERNKPMLTRPQLDRVRGLVFSQAGISKITMNMKLDDASKVLGFNIREHSYNYGDADCHSYALAENDDKWLVRFITRDDVIGKITIFDPEIKMDNGLAVGMPMTQVQKQYAGLYSVKPAYEWPNKMFTIPLTDRSFLGFTGPYMDSDDVRNKPGFKRKIEEVINWISIGYGDIGTVEGCL